MMKFFAPAALAFSVVFAAPAEAARCPSGQIYRVSLKICASRSASMQFVGHARSGGGSNTTRVEKTVATPPPAGRAREEQPEVARNYAPDPEPVAAPTPVRTRGISLPVAAPEPEVASPYGALR